MISPMSHPQIGIDGGAPVDTMVSTPTRKTPRCADDIPAFIFPASSCPPASSTHGNRVTFDMSYVDMDLTDVTDEEDEDDRQIQNAPSFATATSVMTAEGLSDPEGFWIVCSVVLISDMTRGVTFPIMWPLIEDLGGNAVWLGYIVGAFSLGRVIASPVLGRWTIDRGYSKTLVASTTILLVGCILFAHAYEVGSLYFLVFSQIILGIGSGTLGVTRAYVAEISATRQRTTYLALLTAVQYGAFTVTPIFGSLFIHLLGERRYEVGFFIFDQYSVAAYFMASLCVVTLFLLLTRFQARYRTEPAERRISQRRKDQDELANRATRLGISVYNAALLGLMMLNIMTLGSIAAFETTGISFAASYFNLQPIVSGTIVSLSGVVGVCSLLNIGRMGNIMTDTQMLIGGNTIFAVATISFAPLQSVEMGTHNSIVHYSFAMFVIFGFGYPIAQSALTGLFSKVVGRRPQGEWQGWFAASGSFARILFSVSSGYIAHYGDITTVFIILFGVLVTSIIFVAISAKTLVSLSL